MIEIEITRQKVTEEVMKHTHYLAAKGSTEPEGAEKLMLSPPEEEALDRAWRDGIASLVLTARDAIISDASDRDRFVVLLREPTVFPAAMVPTLRRQMESYLADVMTQAWVNLMGGKEADVSSALAAIDATLHTRHAPVRRKVYRE